MHALAGQGWSRLRGGELTAGRAAMSVAVGLAVGATPLYGAHFWIVVALCVPLRLDAALAYLAANISIPPVIPFLLIAEVEIGSVVRNGHSVALTTASAHSRALGELVKELAVGTAIFAPVLGAVGGGVAWGVALAAQKRRLKADREQEVEPLREAIGRVAGRYAGGRRAAYGYVRGKLASDPVARRIASLGSLGEVVDVGCGRGQLAVLLLESGCATGVHGVDWDAVKVADATRAATGLNARFDVGDMRTADAIACDTALLVDVLHYMTDTEQDALVARLALTARHRVIIRDVDPDRGWRSRVTRAQEWVTTGLGYNRGARAGMHARSVETITSPLRSQGWEVKVEPCWGATPFANVLIVAERKVAPV